MSDYNMSIHSSTDAREWTDFFFKTYPNCNVDKETMIGWFANAMMAMYGDQEKLTAERDELLEMLKTVILNFGEIAGNHCDGCEELLEKAQLTIEKYEGDL